MGKAQTLFCGSTRRFSCTAVHRAKLNSGAVVVTIDMMRVRVKRRHQRHGQQRADHPRRCMQRAANRATDGASRQTADAGHVMKRFLIGLMRSRRR